jgi:hypothetical protein
VFTFLFKFCGVSRICAVAELMFGINYMIIQQDNLYNLLFQIIIGITAILITISLYIKKFPMCNISIMTKFFVTFFKKRSCTSAMDQYIDQVKTDFFKNQANADKY